MLHISSSPHTRPGTMPGDVEIRTSQRKGRSITPLPGPTGELLPRRSRRTFPELVSNLRTIPPDAVLFAKAAEENFPITTEVR